MLIGGKQLLFKKTVCHLTNQRRSYKQLKKTKLFAITKEIFPDNLIKIRHDYADILLIQK